MFAITQPSSLSPKALALSVSWQYWDDATKSDSGTSPFSRPSSQHRPRSSSSLDLRNGDVMVTAGVSSGPSPRSTESRGLLSKANRIKSASVTGAWCKEPQIPQSAKQLDSNSRAYTTRDIGTQYSPDGLPPTAAPQKMSVLSTLGQMSMIESCPDANILVTTGGDDVAMADGQTLVRKPIKPSCDALFGLTCALTGNYSGVPISLNEKRARSKVAEEEPRSAFPNSKSIEVPRKAFEHPVHCLVSTASSPTKKSRLDMPAPKVMPRDYMECDLKELGIVVANMLIELVRMNDPIISKEWSLTRFHSRSPPTISIRDYLNRLIVHATLSAPLLLTMVFYIDRLCTMYPAFTITSLTVHRFLITAATVAAKGLSDSFWTNHTYARVGGVGIKELAMLELDFLARLDWTIVPSQEILEHYYTSLVDRADGYILEEGTNA